jgi:phosphatidylglycerol:prolipoprotein diacylglycerol transferase
MASPPIALAEIGFPRVDPVAIDLPGPIDVRWYSLMYQVGFGAGYLILRRLVRRGDLALQPSAVGDLVGWLVLGVIIGGRLGYILFYTCATSSRVPLRRCACGKAACHFTAGCLASRSRSCGSPTGVAFRSSAWPTR